MIRNISYELLGKTKLTTDILLRFRDIEIKKEQFDSIWNACGYPSSNNYDENGNWNPK